VEQEDSGRGFGGRESEVCGLADSVLPLVFIILALDLSDRSHNVIDLTVVTKQSSV
jgi:hypothetical protein